jgi:hypothetical protein
MSVSFGDVGINSLSYGMEELGGGRELHSLSIGTIIIAEGKKVSKLACRSFQLFPHRMIQWYCTSPTMVVELRLPSRSPFSGSLVIIDRSYCEVSLTV